MGTFLKNFIWEAFLFVMLFLLLSLPAIMFRAPKPKKTVELQYPKQERQLASPKSAQATVPTQQCEPKERWKYRCDKDKKNCVKESRVTYLDCHPIDQ